MAATEADSKRDFTSDRRKRILILGNDVESSTYLTSLLQGHLSISVARDMATNSLHSCDDKPHLILFDVGCLTANDLERCASLRRDFRDIPIIVLSSSNDFEMRLKAFEFGADDVLEKPFRPRELLARISSKVRRIEESRGSETLLSRGNVEMNVETFELRVAGEQISLSVLEFNLLRYFVENFERVLNREQILRAVWGNDVMVTNRTVDTHMTSLRKKLRESNLRFVTLYGAGYTLKQVEALSLSETSPLATPEVNYPA